MSDPNTSPSDEQYVSQIDPAFAEAWNSVYNPEPATPPGQGTIEVDPPAERAPAPAPADQGVGGTAPAEAAPPAGVEPGEPADAAPASPAVAPVLGTGLDYAVIAPKFGEASNAITERMENTFRQSAVDQIRSEIDPKFLDVLNTRPMLLVGEKVPNLKDRTQPDMLIRDSNEAREYQETLGGLLEDEVNDLVSSKAENVRPMMNIIQESVLMFQNNPDLVPGTKQYNPTLAKRFTDIAKSYELRVNGKLYGYQVNVQPLINSLRAETGQAPAAAAAPRPAAAAQPRTPTGQFDSPQAGIPSKSGMTGEGSGEDYSVFWAASGLPNVNI